MPFRFGVIGAGGAAALHVPATRTHPEIEAAAIADTDESRAADFARRHGIPEVYGSTETLLAKASVDTLLGRIFFASVTAKFRRSTEHYASAPWRARKAEAWNRMRRTSPTSWRRCGAAGRRK